MSWAAWRDSHHDPARSATMVAMRRTLALGAGLLVGCGTHLHNNDAGNGSGGDGRGGNGDGGGTADALGCGQLAVTFRDFTSSHPDFEKTIADDRGLVPTML